ncbi:DNA mismatch repair endonuclease MutL [Patescibacteria group bacterium]
MNKIKVLPEDLMNKIAAGEVVERPASIVKELVENSLDAGADRIIIEADDGGRKLIRVVDNGTGMSKEDAKLAFTRHATSKIASPDDLWRIKTLGFRGEALPSIASIAKVDLKTRSAKSVAGTLVSIADSKMSDPEETGTPPGTIIEVRDIFHNTPARRKYLKSANTEYGHISSAVTDLALAHPEISFTFKHKKRQVFQLPGKQKFIDRVKSLFGEDLTQNLLPLKYNSPYLQIAGYVGKPSVSRSSRDQQYLFVNGRRVENRLLSKAVFDGYHTLLQKQEYPVYFIFLQLNPDLVDVNVHPQKKEVRFLNQNMIFNAVRDSVQKALEGKELAPRVGFAMSKLNRKISKPGLVFTGRAHGPAPTSKRFSPRQSLDFSRELLSAEPEEKRDYQLLGQVNETYIIIEDQEGMKIIDQHAVHERELYDKFQTQIKNDPPSPRLRRAGKKITNAKCQKLLSPVKIELSAKEAGVIEENFDLIKSFGFEIENFGKAGNVKMYAINAVPADLKDVDVKSFIKNIVDDLINSDRIKKINSAREKIIATMACRGAVKAGDHLSHEEMAHLVDLVRSGKIKTCPHGRPVMVELQWNDLEKQFGRKK